MAWKRTRAKVQQLKKKKKERIKEKNPTTQPCISLTPNAQGIFCEIKNTSDTKPNCTTGLPKNVLQFLKCTACVISWRDCKEKSSY